MKETRANQNTFHDARIPVTLLCGFLGSGKTTLLNRILHENVGRRLAIIVNEFGEINIDSESIIRTEEDLVELSSGCICCTVRTDLVDAIERLVNDPQPPEHILIETTGLADVRPLRQTFVEPPLDETVRLDAIITLVDARHVEQALAESNEAYDQIAHASYLIVNKQDLVDPATLEQVIKRVRQINPRAPLLCTTYAQVELDLLLDTPILWSQLTTADPSTALPHLEAQGYTALTFRSRQPLSRPAFLRLLRTLPANIFRGKGFLWLADDPSERYRFDLTGSTYKIEWWDSWPAGQTPENRMVFIGRGLERDALRRQIEACHTTLSTSPQEQPPS